MGLTHYVQIIILCVIDIVIILLLSGQWIICIRYILIDNIRINKADIFSCFTLLFSLFIFIIIFKNNITEMYSGLIAKAITGRFLIVMLSIPGPLIINDIKLLSVIESDMIQRSQLIIILLIITLLLFMVSIILDILVKHDTKKIQDIITRSLALDRNGLIPDGIERPLGILDISV